MDNERRVVLDTLNEFECRLIEVIKKTGQLSVNDVEYCKSLTWHRYKGNPLPRDPLNNLINNESTSTKST